MKKKFIPALMMTLLISTTPITAPAAGIPVIDVKSIAQAILQLEAWAKQFELITGSRGMGTANDDISINVGLPPGWEDVEAVIQATAQFTVERSKFPTLVDNPSQNKVYDILATNNTITKELYKKSTARIAQVQALMSKIDTADDPAAKQDLMNRLSNEQNMIQANQQLIALLKAQQDSDLAEAKQAALKSHNCKEWGRAC